MDIRKPGTDASDAIPMVGEAPSFLEAVRATKRLARTEAPVLIMGETGTGKELAARSLHRLGPRADRPFVPVNCGALPDGLFESELFGFERGAFTDAKQRQLGLVRLAEGGTLFLDEVDALTAKGQVSLLRFLQDGEVRPLGGTHSDKVDVRIVSASNASLANLSAQGKFRTDLLFRLAVLALHIPPLRERAGDVRLLTRHFVAWCAARYGGKPKRISAETLTALEAHTWPGNIRELQNFVHGAYVLSDGDELQLPRHTVGGPACAQVEPPARHDQVALGLREAKAVAVERFERGYLTSLLRKTSGNVSEAARVAGQDRRALGRLLKKHGLDRSQFA